MLCRFDGLERIGWWIKTMGSVYRLVAVGEEGAQLSSFRNSVFIETI